MENLSEARIYVGTYAKYNNGSIFGEWLDLSDYSDKEEFYDACRKLHSDEEDPEYMFQDWENIPEALISESWISDNLFEIIEAISDLSESNQEAFFIWLDNGSCNLDRNDIHQLIDSFQDDYQGVYQTEEEYAYEVVEQCYDLPEFALRYFDYDSFARDLFISDYWFEDGHVFRNS
ncbi:antirestriction protein ArdA [Bacteroidales bacterium OttesenSCG-928-I14]|nr:antirestriction protein ArdA [Bacteroidales bacterium OttesenSCG-928-I14]